VGETQGRGARAGAGIEHGLPRQGPKSRGQKDRLARRARAAPRLMQHDPAVEQGVPRGRERLLSLPDDRFLSHRFP
jgi:hypothetical protein